MIYKIYAGKWVDDKYSDEGALQTVREMLKAGYKKIIINLK